MRRFKVFFYVFKRSLVDPVYYKDVLKTKFWFSLKYLYFLIFLTALISGITYSARIATYLPKIPTYVSDIKSVVNDFYPEELVITIENGELSTNVEEPYFIYAPRLELLGDDFDYTNPLITFDTNGRFEDIEKYNTVVLIAGRSVFAPDDNGYRVYSVTDIGDRIIDKNAYDDFMAEVLPYLDYLSTAGLILMVMFVLIIPFVITSFSLSSKLLYLLFFSVVMLIFAKVVKRNLSYKNIYRISMHTLTLPILISFLLSLVNFKVPYLYTGVFTVVTGYVIVKGFGKSEKQFDGSQEIKVDSGS